MLLLLLCSFAYAGENYKGKISLLFNGEKIELPITTVSLKKENKILISVRAESSGDGEQQLINLKWVSSKISTNDEDLSIDDFLLNVVNNKNGEKDELRFQMSDDEKDGGLFVRKGNRTWDLTALSMKFNIENVSYEKSSLVISGNLKFEARDAKGEEPAKAISKIEDCKFEIVI
jgi:hypothetical protein